MPDEARPGMASRALEELGLVSLYRAPADVKLLCVQRFVRLFAYGASTLILVTYLKSLAISETQPNGRSWARPSEIWRWIEGSRKRSAVAQGQRGCGPVRTLS